MAKPTAPDEALAVYVHWPYCLAKCPYCDFNSHVRARIDSDAMGAAYRRELETIAARIDALPVSSIFFGGGTPSLMPTSLVADIIETVDTLWGCTSDAEITLEANPTSAEAERSKGYRGAGVNRLSLGMQALDNEALRFLGRQHSVREALAALEIAATIFPRTSADLIYGRPGQSVADWEAELAEALGLPVQHLSLYQLTIEKGTPFFQEARDGRLIMPEEDAQRTLFDLTGDMTRAAGLAAYEISNHARSGEACRHNISYWRYAPYVGIGPGAHGRLPSPDGGRTATRMHAKPETWLEAVTHHGEGSAEWSPVAPVERASEALMMGLRLTGGIDAGGFRQATGVALAEAISAADAEQLMESGFVDHTAESLRVTEKGRPFLNALLARLAS